MDGCAGGVAVVRAVRGGGVMRRRHGPPCKR
jgi:hypothetical protein